MQISLGAVEYQDGRKQTKGLRVAQKFALALTMVTLAAVFLGTAAGPANDAPDALIGDASETAELPSETLAEPAKESEAHQANLEGSQPSADLSAGAATFAK